MRSPRQRERVHSSSPLHSFLIVLHWSTFRQRRRAESARRVPARRSQSRAGQGPCSRRPGACFSPRPSKNAALARGRSPARPVRRQRCDHCLGERARGSLSRRRTPRQRGGQPEPRVPRRRFSRKDHALARRRGDQPSRPPLRSARARSFLRASSAALSVCRQGLLAPAHLRRPRSAALWASPAAPVHGRAAGRRHLLAPTR
jgi:hypothetical protein